MKISAIKFHVIVVICQIDSLQESVDFPWAAIVKLLIWTAIGLALALRFFSYEPSGVGHKSETETCAQLPTEIET